MMPRSGLFSVFALLLFSLADMQAQVTVIINTGASWRYLQTGVDPPSAWTQLDFNDAAWQTGPSPLGYGEDWLATPLNSAPFTAYFRHDFQIPALPAGPVLLRVKRDDGVVVYLNGAEIFRNNMPGGPVNYNTPALSPCVEQNFFFEHWVAPSFFSAGNNVIAAEAHQCGNPSSDLFFDLQLQDTNGPAGPRVAITRPANNATVPAGVDLTVTALAEPVAEIGSVEFYDGDFFIDLDVDSPYGIVWPEIPEGSYVLRAVARFLDGSSITSAPVQFTAAMGPPLSVSITSPANNSIFPPGDIAVQASVSVPAGVTVSLVEFFADGLGIGEASSEPYSLLWTEVAEGDYSLTARAWDTTGASVTSAPVFIQVRAGDSQLLRGPYLQSGTPTSIIIKWRTSNATDSLVRYGLNPNNLNQTAPVGTITTEHEVPLGGLSPDTKYYYSVGSGASTHSAGSDHFFITSPARPKPTRIWVIGDSGTAAAGATGAAEVRDAYYAYTGTRYTDLWLMLGDNAYYSGTDDEYQRGMFDVYPQMLRQTVVWSTIGNHDASPAYFDIFSLPKNGEAGGIPSGVENYYSFDYGDIHFICLGGYFSGSRLSNGVMCTWLKADLEANTNKWLIAFWHQPPYTKGSHDSDTESDLVQMRQNAVPILESYGVDLVLCGHSHVYERSYLLHGHYGFSSQFDSDMRVDPGSGQMENTGPYIKQENGANANRGTVYAVVGSSGWVSGCCRGLNHPAMFTSLGVMGSLVMDIDGDTLHATFLRENGAIDDHFTLIKESTIVRIVQITRQPGATTLTWISKPGKHYQIHHSNDLAGPWIPVGNPIEAASTLTQRTHAPAVAPQGFYRVLQVD